MQWFFGQGQLEGDSKIDAVLIVVCIFFRNDVLEVVLFFHRVVLNIHQNGSEVFDDGGDVVIGRLFLDGIKYFRGLFEGKGDLFGRRHDGLGMGVFLSVLLVIS